MNLKDAVYLLIIAVFGICLVSSVQDTKDIRVKYKEAEVKLSKKLDRFHIQGSIKQVDVISTQVSYNNEPAINEIKSTTIRFVDGREKRFVGMSTSNLDKWKTYAIVYNGLDEIVDVKELKE